MLTYKGLPAPIICDYLSREASRKLYSRGHRVSNPPLGYVGTLERILIVPSIATQMAPTSPIYP